MIHTARDLIVKDVSVSFGGVRALNSLSLRALPGRITGIIGPNGCGKSTLLGAIFKSVAIEEGSIRFGEVDLESSRRGEASRLGIARTFQTVRLLPDLDVRGNVSVGADSAPRHRRKSDSGHRFASMRDRVNAAIARTGLEGMEHLLPHEMSYGNQRRVEIARAIASEPALMIMDEPTAGMNSTERDEVSSLLRRLLLEGIPQLLIEHDIRFIVDTCDYLYCMSAGSVICDGAPDDVANDERVQEAYFGRKSSTTS